MASDGTFNLDDKVEVDGQDTGLTLGDLLAGPGVFLTPTEEETNEFMLEAARFVGMSEADIEKLRESFS